MDEGGNLSLLSNVIEATTAAAPAGWWDGFGANALNDDVECLLSHGGNLFVGGQFTSAGGTDISRIAVWNEDGWSAIGEGLTGGLSTIVVNALAVHNGSLYLGGAFTTAGGHPSSFIARWDD
jgi:hypothetical protein